MRVLDGADLEAAALAPVADDNATIIRHTAAIANLVQAASLGCPNDLFIIGMMAERDRRCTTRRASCLEAVDDGLSEFAAADLVGTLHQSGEVVGHDLVRDRLFERRDDVVGSLLPAEVLEHEDA
jgi:hypothetical protein